MMGAAYPIGFIGLGTMGEAMALTLVKAGTRLLVWNRTRAKAEILAAAGADVAREAADVFAHSATVFLMLVDGGAIDTVLDRGGTAFASVDTSKPAICGQSKAAISCRRPRLVSSTSWRPPCASLSGPSCASFEART
jgi:3-hydroxyisobutyrate dehydrogenase-like beta-hydroxyacid dehydrogenase